MVEIIFDRPKGSVWYWNLPLEKDGTRKGSVPLVGVELKGANTLKECLDLIAKVRDEEWVGKMISDFLRC